MNYKLKKHGFSLAEVMMASAILAVGLLMIAGTFPVAIFLMTGSVEQSIAPIVADEAFAKIQLYASTPVLVGINQVPALNLANLVPAAGMPLQRDFVREFDNIIVTPGAVKMAITEEVYPSVSVGSNSSTGLYSWAALCRKIDTSNANDPMVQVTVFVSRKTGGWLKFPTNQPATVSDWPTPVNVDIASAGAAGTHIVTISNANHQKYIADGCTIVADGSGTIYRVLNHYNVPATTDIEVVLDKDWTERLAAWIIPPPASGGRSPCIGVYQRIIRF